MKTLLKICSRIEGSALKFLGKEHYPWWHELTGDERKVIRNSGDCPVISVVKGIRAKELERIDKSIKVGAQTPGYNTKQLQWVADELWYLGECLGHKPSSMEIANDMKARNIARCYRLYAAANMDIDRISIKWNLPTFRFFVQVYRETGGYRN